MTTKKIFIRLSYLLAFVLIFGACKRDKPQPAPNSINSAPQVAAPATKPVAEAGTHIVAKGESLYQVAQQYGISVQELKDFNPTLKLEQDSNWKVGLKVKVKQPKAEIKEFNSIASSPATAVKETSATDKSTWKYHYLKEGENLYRVSVQYKISLEALLKLNPSLKNEIQDLPVGQRVRVR